MAIVELLLTTPLTSQTLAQSSSVMSDAVSIPTGGVESTKELVYSFTRPVMDERERVRQTILFGALMLVSIVILVSTIIAYFVYQRHLAKLGAVSEGDAERTPQSQVRAPARGRGSAPPSSDTRKVPTKQVAKKVERPRKQRSWSTDSSDFDD